MIYNVAAALKNRGIAFRNCLAKAPCLLVFFPSHQWDGNE